MPFTLAHPAAVVPLQRVWRRLSLSALVAGSLAPDFEYVIRLPLSSGASHTPLGVFTFCLPVGLFVLWLFHTSLKRPLLLLLPSTIRQPFLSHAGPFPFWPFPTLAWIILTIILGAFSHLTWDAFTHTRGWGVALIPWLQTSFTLAGFRIQAFNVAQHGSTLVGLSLLAVWAWRWFIQQPRPAVPADPPEMARLQRIGWTICLFVPLATGIALGVGRTQTLSGFVALRIFIVNAAVGGMIGLFVAALLVSLLVLLNPRATRRA